MANIARLGGQEGDTNADTLPTTSTITSPPGAVAKSAGQPPPMAGSVVPNPGEGLGDPDGMEVEAEGLSQYVALPPQSPPRPRSSREAPGASAAKEAAGETLEVEEEETQGLTPLHWAQVQIYHISLKKSSLGGRYIGICQARPTSAAICVLTVTNRTRGVNANLGPLRL